MRSSVLFVLPWMLAISPGCLLFASPNVDGGAAPDGGRLDGGPSRDGGDNDGGDQDAGSFDAGPITLDGGRDGGPFDGGGRDGGGLDGGQPDGGDVDAGPIDGGNDAGLDGGDVDGGAVDAGEHCLAPAGEPIEDACLDFYQVWGATPALMTTTGAQNTLRLHGRFLPEDDVNLVWSTPTGLESLRVTVVANGTIGEVSIPFGTYFVGTASVTGNLQQAYGQVNLNIRAHEVFVGPFQSSHSQESGGRRLSAPWATTPAGNIQPFLTESNLLCGAGGDGSREVVCLRTDVDGAPRDVVQPLNPIPGSSNFFLAAREGAAVVYANRRVYRIGGDDELGGTTNVVTSGRIGLSGAASDLRAEATMLRDRRDAAAVVVGSRLCVVGGHDGINIDETIECAPFLDDGRLGAFGFAGTLSTPRFGARAEVVGADLVVVGGSIRFGIGGATSMIERAALTDGTFVFTEQDAGENAQRSFAATFVIDEAIYVIGGLPISGPPVDTFSVFDDVGEHKTQIALPQGRHHFGAAVVGNFVYLSPGEDAGPPLIATFISSDSLAEGTSAPLQSEVSLNRGFASVARVSNRVFRIGGTSAQGDTLTTVDEHTFDRSGHHLGTQLEVATLPEARSHTCAVVLDNKIYVLGGRGAFFSSSYLDAKSMFVGTVDPTSGALSFMTVPSALPDNRVGPNCVVLQDKVLILGGDRIGNNVATNFSVLSAPIATLVGATATNVDALFSLMTIPTASDTAARWMASAFVEPGNSVVVSGGLGANGMSLNNSVRVVFNGAMTAVLQTEVVSESLPANAAAFSFSDTLATIGGGDNGFSTSRNADLVTRGALAPSQLENVLSQQVRGHSGVLIGSTIQVIGGRSENSSVPVAGRQVIHLTRSP